MKIQKLRTFCKEISSRGSRGIISISMYWLYGWRGSKLRGCMHIYILRVDCVVSPCYYVDLRRVFESIARVLITFLRIFFSIEPCTKLDSFLAPLDNSGILMDEFLLFNLETFFYRIIKKIHIV